MLQTSHVATSIRAVALRELHEELGFDAPMGCLPRLEYRGADANRPDFVWFVFDGGVFSKLEIERIRLPVDELAEFRFVPSELVGEFCPERLANRVQHARKALETGGFAYLEDSTVV
jgi:8-oxo-dGTP pyrophosphatase MutT (NUDIX family)